MDRELEKGGIPCLPSKTNPIRKRRQDGEKGEFPKGKLATFPYRVDKIGIQPIVGIVDGDGDFSMEAVSPLLFMGEGKVKTMVLWHPKIIGGLYQ